MPGADVRLVAVGGFDATVAIHPGDDGVVVVLAVERDDVGLDGVLEMNRWFSVVLLFETEVVGPSDDDALCEASVRVVEAADIEVAKDKAQLLGRRLEHDYLNQNGERVTWRFRRVVEVQEIGEATIVDGVEVFSRLFWKSQSEEGSPLGCESEPEQRG